MDINTTIKRGILLTALSISALCLFQAKPKMRKPAENLASASNKPADAGSKSSDASNTLCIVNNEPVVYLDNTDQISVQGEGIQSVAYSSGNKKVAKISKRGKITPKKKGTTTIRAKVAYRTDGQNYKKTLSYQLKILGKSKEYFEFTDDDPSYDREGDPAVITGLTEAGKKLKELYIPERYQKEKITKICCGAFDEGSAMEKVYISDYVEHLDYWDEYEGSGFMDEGCFNQGCSSLKAIHLGKNVKTFGRNENLPNLETITVTPKNQTFYVEHGILFSRQNKKNDMAKNAIICYPAKKRDASYTIPDGITHIEGGAFCHAKSLEQVHFPKGIESIGSHAFSYTGLKDVALPKGIYDFTLAFDHCSCLTKAVIPQIPDDGSMAGGFEYCPILKTVITENSPRYFFGAFSGCGSLEGIQFSADVKGIVQREGVLFDSDMQTLLFYPAGKKDQRYQVPAGVKKIHDYAFDGTQHLSEVTMNSDLQTIGESAFFGSKITTIHLNQTLKEVGLCAFERSDISELHLPDDCNIDFSIVKNCKKLCSIKFPANQEQLYMRMEGCSSLRTLLIPKKVKDLIALDLKGCTSLSSITVERGSKHFAAVNGVLYTKSKKTLIAYPPAKRGKKFSVPKSVRKISADTFTECRFLQEISMKDSVASCQRGAFSGGAALRTVRLSKNLKKIETGLFSHCRKLQKITIPDKVKKIESSVFWGCTSLKSITLGKKVKKIDWQAFWDCRSLQKLTFRKKTWERGLTLEKCFVKAGSKNYHKLVLKLPKKWKKDRGLVMHEFYDAGLSKKAKIKYY